MKLNIESFERLAKERGFRSGYDLAADIGIGRNTYHYIKQTGEISSDMVTEIYNRFGDEAMFEVFDFDDD